MKKILASILVVIGISLSTSAQLPNGSTSPDFILTDIDGNTHHLHDYLAQGKVVFIKFFACHCPSCWAYHNTGKLESLYQTYGPDGTDQIRVLMLEHDEYNDDAFYGLGGYTQGDWTAGNSIPMVNVEGADRSVFADYNMVYYPMVYKVCPDKTTELMSTAYTVAELFQEADDCAGTLSINETQQTGEIHIDYVNHQLILDNFEDVSEITIINSVGQQVNFIDGINSNVIDLNMLVKGVYFLRIEHSKGTMVRKMYLQ